DLHSQRGVVARQGGDGAGEDRVRSGLEDGDPDDPADGRAGTGDGGLRRVEGVEDVGRPPGEQFALRRELQAAAGLHEKDGARLPFERGELLGDRRGAVGERGRDAGDGAADPQLVEETESADVEHGNHSVWPNDTVRERSLLPMIIHVENVSTGIGDGDFSTDHGRSRVASGARNTVVDMVEDTDDARTMRPEAGGAVSRAQLAQEAVELVRRWLAESARSGEDAPRDPAAERLAGVLRDPHGLDFAVGFVDGVARPQDLFVAGYNLQRVAKKIPAFLPWYMRFAIWLGGVFGPVLPWVVIPIARRVLRSMVGHLVVDATPQKLGPAIEHLRRPADPSGHGARLNLNLLGEAVLGEKEAARRLEGTYALLARDDVDYVSIKVSSIASQLSMWSFDETVERVIARLTPLYQLAASSPKPKFINLDMEEYRDLDLTIAVFTGILNQPGFEKLEAGIVLQTYLPDALDALQGLTEWATERRMRGGAPIKVRVVKGA